MSKFQVIEHPLIQHKLTIMREKDTPTSEFKQLLDEISMLMGYEITRNLPTEEVEIAQLSKRSISAMNCSLFPSR